ncbi:MAG: 3-hydroxylacyl-ACP dehydratase [Alphaproteobacteria bacterium]|nr:3-hydroxylacyl-ACP dehydratase [Alphaproteobacteria bacterium]
MNNKKYLSTILPHKEQMLLIDDIVGYSIEEKWLKSVVTIREDSLFFDKKINGIDSVIGIEYMAQTIGCYAFFRKQLAEPKIGFLLGTRLYNNSVKTFEAGKTYYILVKEVFVAEIYSFECFIYNEKEEEIASATINVYQDDNSNIREVLNG